MAFKSDRRLYLSRDRSKIVEEGDGSAAFLFAAPGDEISEQDAEYYKLDYRDGRIVTQTTEPEPKKSQDEEPKAVKTAEDKMVRKREDKAITRGEKQKA